MKTFSKKIGLIFKRKAFLSVAVFPLLLGGCNTMEGAGTDIKKGGEALERAAEKGKDCNPPCVPANKDCNPPCPPASQHSRSRQYQR